MIERRRHLRAVLVGLGIFAVLLALAAALVRVGRPSPAPEETHTASPATTTPAVGDESRVDSAQDEASAVEAALAYAAAPQAWLYMTDDELRSAVAAIALPETADRIANEVVDEISSSRSELAESAGPVWWIVHPLAWRVDDFTEADATVLVWTFSLLSAADVAVPQTDWTTTTVNLEWVDGSWLVASVRDAVGPTPSIGPADQPWEPEPLDDALEGFTRLTWDDHR